MVCVARASIWANHAYNLINLWGFDLSNAVDNTLVVEILNIKICVLL